MFMYWDIVCAALGSIVLGFLWYGPIFGKQWMKLMNISEKEAKKAKKKGMPAHTYVLMILSALLTALVLKLMLVQFPFRTLDALFATAGIIWVGFNVPLALDSVLYEGKSWKLFILNSGYRLVSLLVMTYIYTLF